MSIFLFHRCSSDAGPKNACRDLLFPSVFFLLGDLLDLTGDADAVFAAAFLGVAGAALVLDLDLDFDPVDFVFFGRAVTSLALAAIELEIRRGGGPCEAVSDSSSSSSEKTIFDVRRLFAGGEAMHNGEQAEPEKLGGLESRTFNQARITIVTTVTAGERLQAAALERAFVGREVNENMPRLEKPPLGLVPPGVIQHRTAIHTYKYEIKIFES